MILRKAVKNSNSNRSNLLNNEELVFITLNERTGSMSRNALRDIYFYKGIMMMAFGPAKKTCVRLSRLNRSIPANDCGISHSQYKPANPPAMRSTAEPLDFLRDLDFGSASDSGSLYESQYSSYTFERIGTYGG